MGRTSEIKLLTDHDHLLTTASVKIIFYLNNFISIIYLCNSLYKKFNVGILWICAVSK